ncbi:MAG: hypothetical protein E5Y88_09490 [Mesorhizobium sp.]|uniref:hypothetical protein n=1 Tax=Mesorhizobium sp. TaxID=1871066 RepID=UPI000FE99EF5|nr:hypothetical protein [Mesorhizobium sp.]RWQ40891.1 MAG: hypothetical protein EOS20_02345 [Mesorhizobium sp.]TIL26041.1 MAG: hypothetical protein E5Y88_09490 [Mesorhizobium sp.]
MAPRRKSDDPSEGPTIEQQDWDAIKGGKILPDSVPGNGDIRYDLEKEGELPEEDDDNPYQDSDEALPDDEEEGALARNPSKQDIDEP